MPAALGHLTSASVANEKSAPSSDLTAPVWPQLGEGVGA